MEAPRSTHTLCGWCGCAKGATGRNSTSPRKRGKIPTLYGAWTFSLVPGMKPLGRLFSLSLCPRGGNLVDRRCGSAESQRHTTSQYLATMHSVILLVFTTPAFTQSVAAVQQHSTAQHWTASPIDLCLVARSANTSITVLCKFRGYGISYFFFPSPFPSRNWWPRPVNHGKAQRIGVAFRGGLASVPRYLPRWKHRRGGEYPGHSIFFARCLRPWYVVAMENFRTPRLWLVGTDCQIPYRALALPASPLKQPPNRTALSRSRRGGQKCLGRLSQNTFPCRSGTLPRYLRWIVRSSLTILRCF